MKYEAIWRKYAKYSHSIRIYTKYAYFYDLHEIHYYCIERIISKEQFIQELLIDKFGHTLVTITQNTSKNYHDHVKLRNLKIRTMDKPL